MGPKLTKIRQQVLATLLILFICGISLLLPFVMSLSPWLKVIDYEILDLLMILKGGIKANENIVIVKIDGNLEKQKGEAYGPEWRKFHPQVIENLKEAKVIAFDLTFYSEKPYDEALGNKMRERQNIVIATLKEEDEKEEIPDSILLNGKPGYADFDYGRIFRKVRGLKPIILKEEKGTVVEGMTPFYWEPSFLFRILQVNDGLFYQESHKGRRIYSVIEEGNILLIGTRKIPRDGDGMMYVRNIAKSQEFLEISYHNAYYGNFSKTLITPNKIVIIGVTEKHIDRHWTPYGRKYGVMLNALALNTVLQGEYVHFTKDWLYFLMLLSSTLIYSTALLSPRKNYLIAVTGVMLILPIASTLSSFWIQIIPIILAMIISHYLIKLLTKYYSKSIFPNYFLLRIIFVLSGMYFGWFVTYCISLSDPDPVLNIIVMVFAGVAFWVFAGLFIKRPNDKKEKP